MIIRSIAIAAMLLGTSMPAARADDHKTLFAATGYCLAVYNVARLTYEALAGSMETAEKKKTLEAQLARVKNGYTVLSKRVTFRDKWIEDMIIDELKEAHAEVSKGVLANDGSVILIDLITECDYLFDINT